VRKQVFTKKFGKLFFTFLVQLFSLFIGEHILKLLYSLQPLYNILSLKYHHLFSLLYTFSFFTTTEVDFRINIFSANAQKLLLNNKCHKSDISC
jgi:hypothetical protein